MKKKLYWPIIIYTIEQGISYLIQEQGKFRVLNKNLVSIDIEEFWYQTSNISIDIKEFWYRTSTTSVAYCASTGNCNMWILDVQRNYRVSNKIQVSIGIEQNMVLNQH